ncbi:DUF1737 domain-containing protein [Aquicoccus porphyridii]|uniref:DUF1737 domain-containing protein n=1 Tax=Aquicoccus porphyridii TaxID=1852029 RepID=A0A5A9ZHR4_9RHOB|nr:DUF1737 domain-containing protein [Aquicoccus porphyridii]KAA0916691.1 DUF1737 domain-containing protein [Aquicoccus porphyridii]RAI53818.1 hypothetical protein DOO74_10335 [Rhodobacteraceae bacterium AsT-22]
MSEIIEYRIISAIYTRTDAGEDRDRLSNQVNQFIKTGWQPHGSATSAVLEKDGAIVVMQPIVKYG